MGVEDFYWDYFEKFEIFETHQKKINLHSLKIYCLIQSILVLEDKKGNYLFP